MFQKNDPNKPDHEFLKAHFLKEGRLTEAQALWILNKGTEILKKESNIVDIEAPLTGFFFLFRLAPLLTLI